MRAPETIGRAPFQVPMPIYEYRCNACGHEFDELQKFADAALTDCPDCSKPALIKKVSAAGSSSRARVGTRRISVGRKK